MAAYATRAEATAYFLGRLNSDVYDDAEEADQTAALTMATTLMDMLNYRGDKADSSQSLQFPRGSDTAIPQDIKNACAEIALALLDGVDPELEFENLRMKSQAYGVVKSTFVGTRSPEHTVAGIPSSIAWRFMKPYVRPVTTVDMHRVS